MQLVAPAVARHVLPHGPACALRPQAAGFLRVNPDRAKDVNPVALRDGAIVPETSGVWRDLLPKGVVPDMTSIQLREGDSIKRAYTLEDYKGSN